MTTSKMVATVGTNPLPIFLGAKQFLAEDAVLWLIGSDGVAKEMGAIEATIQGLGNSITVLRVTVDPYNFLDCFGRVENIYAEDSWLNYTGGTKVMSAAAPAAWMVKGGAHAQSSILYLSDDDQNFVLGNGNAPIALQPDLLTMDELLTLHGRTRRYRKANPTANLEFIKAMRGNLNAAAWKALKEVKAVLFVADSDENSRLAKERQLAEAWYDATTKTFKTDSPIPILLRNTIPAVARNVLSDWISFLNNGNGSAGFDFPTADDWKARGVNEARLKSLIRYIGGGWFEDFVRQAVLALSSTNGHAAIGWRPAAPLVQESNMVSSVTFLNADDGDDFESDLIIVHKNRLRYISVTLGGEVSICKGKAFEALARARQLGGALAKIAVVCNLSPQKAKLLAESIDDTQLCIFAKDDTAAWTSNNGLNGLATWVNS